jgi:hypothetical protein
VHENIPAGLAIASLGAAIVLPIIRPVVSASPKASAETLKQLEAEFMEAAADKTLKDSWLTLRRRRFELANGGP